jgi:hypothetical protein
MNIIEQNSNNTEILERMVEETHILEENSISTVDSNRTIRKTSSLQSDVNDRLILTHGTSTYKELLRLELLTVFPVGFIKKHKFDSNYRTKLVDWMMEVMHVFECEAETIFLSLSLFDSFLNTSKNISKDKLHLICTTCIYIASKMEDIMPINVNSIYNKILHKKYKQ